MFSVEHDVSRGWTVFRETGDQRSVFVQIIVLAYFFTCTAMLS